MKHWPFGQVAWKHQCHYSVTRPLQVLCKMEQRIGPPLVQDEWE
jgi:hypothetical protein